MKASEIEKVLRANGAKMVRQKGSHQVWTVGTCTTVVPCHAGVDIKPGTLRAIERSMEPCLGKKWLTRG